MYREIKDLPPLCVINSYGDQKPEGYPFLKLWLLKLAYAAIRAYQQDKYPNSERVDAVHSVARIYGNYILDVTYPVASLHMATLDPARKYRAYKWVGADLIDELSKSQDKEQRMLATAVVQEAYQTAVKFHGRGYDVLQLVGIAWQKIFAAILKKYLPPPFNETKLGELLSIRTLLGLGKVRTVCSAGSHAALIAAYKTLKKSEWDLRNWGYELPPRPLGDQYVELTCPADYENHPTFVEVPLLT